MSFPIYALPSARAPILRRLRYAPRTRGVLRGCVLGQLPYRPPTDAFRRRGIPARTWPLMARALLAARREVGCARASFRDPPLGALLLRPQRLSMFLTPAPFPPSL